MRATGKPPRERMYAKLVLREDGTKTYESITAVDLNLYEMAQDELTERPNAYPVVAIEPGYNTNQALGYGYRHWHEMFNAKQLLCLSILGERIAAINEPAMRELFACLFSGTLEFNNMFASYKGEGTGAVRHMFAHHILKPERTPLEANLWGTRKSSGSFSTMFAGRIRRALDYAEHPFELAVSNSEGKRTTKKVYGLSEALGHRIADNYGEFEQGKRLYLSCGDSSRTDLPDRSVDAIVTDPPFFDNVHYSQLADFFHVWQQHVLGEPENATPSTTRSDREVQNEDANTFADRLGAVWREAHRVMKTDGVMAFSYHHSRPEGWSAVLCALMTAGFVVTATQPIKAEMSVATPKRQAKEPIDLDLIVVCRKRDVGLSSSLIEVEDTAISQVARFCSVGRKLSRNDVRVIVMGQALSLYSQFDDPAEAVRALEEAANSLEEIIDRAHTISAEQLFS